MIEVLSLHFTSRCNFKCPFCYVKPVKEKNIDFFTGIIRAASEYNIPQIAIGGGESLLFPKAVSKLVRTAKHYDMKISLTTNGSLVHQTKKHLKDIDLISVSVDHYKVKAHSSIDKIRSIVDELSDFHTMLGINYLVLDRNALKLMLPICNYFKRENLNFYILQPKYYKLDYSSEEMVAYIYLLTFFTKVYVDESTALILGKIKECGYGNKIISIFPDGSISPCSFSSPISKIKEPDQILEVIDSYYPMKGHSKCPYVIR